MAYTKGSFLGFAGVPGAAAGDNRVLAAYSTNDTAATVEGANYFNDAVTLLPLGSQIFVAGDLDGTPFQKTYVVSANDGTTVTITPAATATFTSKYVLHASLVPLTDGTYWLGTAQIAGVIEKISTVVSGTVATNDGICTFRIGTTNITNGVVTVATSGSAAGVKDDATPTAARTVVAGDALSVVVSGTPGSSRTLEVNILIAAS